MHPSLKFFRIAAALSMVLCSFSLLIYVIRLSPAHAQPPVPQNNGAAPVGIIYRELQQDGVPGFLIHVVGYDAAEKKVKVLEKEWVKR